MAEDLKKLRKMINSAIDNILEVCERCDEDFPSLELPADPSEFSGTGIWSDPITMDAITLGVSAASQMIATLQSPMATINAYCGKVSSTGFLVDLRWTLNSCLVSSGTSVC